MEIMVDLLQYSCLQPGSHGAGGEYVVQLGFGWSNGVAMDLMNTYGQQLDSASTGQAPE